MSYEYIPIDNPAFCYRLKDMGVFFPDLDCLDVIKTALDEKGSFKSFPGITPDERWQGKHRLGQCYDVRFGADFYSLEKGEYLMLWTIQPSGWHWMDSDGFGFSGDSHIMLYSVLDPGGKFADQFRLFSIDRTRYSAILTNISHNKSFHGGVTNHGLYDT